jgi:hypothetical protein
VDRDAFPSSAWQSAVDILLNVLIVVCTFAVMLLAIHLFG